MQDDVEERTSRSIIRDFESYGYTKEEIMALADEVAAKGRDGDELLAYLSPESVEFLKERGGSGTINPATGLPEFFSLPPATLQRLKEVVAEQVKIQEAAAAKTAADAKAAVDAQAAADAKTAADAQAAADAKAAVDAKTAADARAAEKAASDVTAKAMLDKIPIGKIAAPSLGLDNPPVNRAPLVNTPPPPSGNFVPPSGEYGVPTSSDGKWLYSSGKWYPNEKISLPEDGPPSSSTPVTPLRPAPVAAPAPSIPYTPPAVPGQMGLPSMTRTGNAPVADIPISMPTMVDYSSRGVGAVGTANTAANKNYFAMTPQTPTGLAPGSVALGPSSMPLYGARNTLGAIGANPNLSPGILGGQQNAGVMQDRLGNPILAPGAAPVYSFAKGGGVDVAALLAQNTETLSDEEPEEGINTNPVGTAQKFLADLNNAGKASPTRQSIKRVKTSPGGGATADKAMQLAYEDLAKGDLGVMKDRAPAARNTESARSQMEELARIYQMKIRSAQESARGLSANTFGAPTLEGATLTKGRLTKKRFAEGGEAKKSVEVEEPSIFNLTNYATETSARMFPGQMGQDDQRDAARHMLAAATVARKYGKDAASFLGKAHERTSNPESFFSMFGIGKPRYDYAIDLQNNQIGVELGMRAKSQAEIEKLVQELAMQSENKPTKGKPVTLSLEQLRAIDAERKKSAAPPDYSVNRAEGSPPEGEESLDQYYAPKARPSTGLNRKKGPISQALDSGDAYVNMAKGVTEMPYNLAGGPMDLVMLARQALTGDAPAGQVGTSDYIKRKMTELGIRPEPPADPTAKGFYTAGDLLSNLANPAGVTRTGVKVAQKTGQAAGDAARTLEDLTVGEVQRARVRKAGRKAQDIPDTAYDPLRERLEATGSLAYAVRPTGSTMLTGPVGLDKNVSEVDQLLSSGIRNAGNVAGQNAGQEKLIEDFWDKKARNYFTRQFGTPDDPIARDIAGKKIKGTPLNEMFPRYLLDQLAVGKTRVKEGARPEDFVGPGTPQTRFFPEYPEAMEDFTSRYDKATGLKGNFITRDPAAADPEYNNLLSSTGRSMARNSGELEADRLLRQGVRPELINPEVGTVTRSIKDPSRVIGDGTSSAKALYNAFEEASAYNKMTPEQQLAWANDQFGKGRSQLSGMAEADVGKNLLSENVLTAIQKGEPVYDISNLGKPLDKVFNPASINKYLASLSPSELANIRFEDAVRGGLKLSYKINQFENVVARIKAGKPVADSVFSNGVSAPLMQFGKDSGFDGFAWKRIEKREATVPEGAYVGHSVGGYELGGIGYTKEKQEGFNTGKYQVYTLRDNRNKPVNTIEVKMLNEYTPVVMQIKGNGARTGNVPAEKYDRAILSFLEDFLKPAAVEEENDLLTPILQKYKEELNASFKMP